jgi:serine phosphatase RsbU (regulator of sigma subunit)
VARQFLHGRVVDRFLFTDQGGIQSPAEVIRILNSRFCSEESDITSYFTIIYGVIDPESGRGVLCQAGHPTPVIVNADSAVTSVGNGGPPVGLMPDLSWEDVAFTLNPGIAYAYSVTVLRSVRTSAASSLARSVSNAGFMTMPDFRLTSSWRGSVTT